MTLRKHAHAIYKDFFFQKQKWKISFSTQNIHCGHTLEPPCRGGSNECPQCMFWIKSMKLRYTPANPSFSF